MQPIQFFAARAEDGALLPGATVDVFVSGSNTRAEIYATPDTGNRIANPLTSDGNARVFFYTREPRIDIRIRRGGYVAPMMEGIVTVDPQDALLAAAAAVVRAETAADTAQNIAQIKPDVATGLLETAEGRYFCVISPGVEEYLILYRKVAGLAVEMKRTSSDGAIAAIRELIDTNPGEDGSIAASFLDTNRFVLMKLLVDGTLDLLGARLRSAGDGLEVSDPNGFMVARLGALGSDINGWVTRPTDRVGTEYVDQYGFMFGRVDAEKAYFGTPSTQPSVVPIVAQLDRQQRTDHKQIIEYGQSLSVGVNALPAISLSQAYGNLMLASGVRVRAEDPTYDARSYVPLVEANDSGNQGETPVAGICNGITRRAVADGESAARWVMLGMSPGRSGAPIELLSPAPLGSARYFERMVQQIKDCHALSLSLGKTYSVWAYSWEQGESNYMADFENSPYQYMQYLLSLFDQLTEQVVAIVGQKFRPYIFSYQVAAHRRYTRDDMPIALTQWRISRQRPDFVLAVPCYMFHVAADNLHLTAESSWLLGEYKSRAIYETMVRRAGKWRPLEPVAVDWRSDHIDISFHVPCGELVLDAALAALTPNFGFDIREGGTVVTTLITSVEVTSATAVRLTLARPTTVDATLTYARGRVGDPAHSGPATGARGNLRDTHGLYDTAVSPLGNTFALHNPCVMFEYSRKTGF